MAELNFLPPHPFFIGKKDMVYDQIFMGAGVLDGEGGDSERYLKLGSGVIKKPYLKQPKGGWVRTQIVLRKRGS